MVGARICLALWFDISLDLVKLSKDDRATGWPLDEQVAGVVVERGQGIRGSCLGDSAWETLAHHMEIGCFGGARKEASTKQRFLGCSSFGSDGLVVRRRVANMDPAWCLLLACCHRTAA